MKNPSRLHLTTACLLALLIFSLQSCDDPGVQFQKSKVQFALNPANTSEGRLTPFDLPKNSTLRISIESSSGDPIVSDHEIKVSKVGETYIADPLDLVPGSYVITDFIIVNEEEVLNAAPKAESPLSSMVTSSLPYNFLVTENGVAKVSMQVLDARNEKPDAFGYTSFKLNAVNKLSFIVSDAKGGQSSLRKASAELRKGKQLIKTFSVKPGMNSVAFEGEQDAMYTLSVFAGETANAKTFNFKALKKELGAKPLKINLEPALLLTIESSVDESNEYGESFEFFLDGAAGSVNINWGDGGKNTFTLPLNASHEYTMGSYTAIITGDLDQITNLNGFSYGTVIYGIKGLTNLTALKTYNPSWGAVPIKVDLSNCNELETIYVEKHGGPYETVDLRTDFKLPTQHFISEFVFYAPSFDITRENISAEELEVFVDNIYSNTTQRSIHGGKFFVYPVETPSAETQRKLDILQNDYDWDVRLDGNIWDYASEAGRSKQDLNVLRDNWLRDKFPHKKDRSQTGKMGFLKSR
jgi:hypothetical protein